MTFASVSDVASLPGGPIVNDFMFLDNLWSMVREPPEGYELGYRLPKFLVIYAEDCCSVDIFVEDFLLPDIIIW